MSATDELRRLLDERGVEWDNCVGPFPQTAFSVNGVVWQVKELVAGLDVSTRYLTPEQAVEATLGSGECTVVSKLLIEGEYVPSSYYEFEMECGEGFKWDESIPPRFCPNCGRKVVDA